MSKTFRFKFSEEINNKLSNFGRLYSYADDEDIIKYWRAWLNENKEMIINENTRLIGLGYKGNIYNKLYKSVKYYWIKVHKLNNMCNNNIKNNKFNNNIDNNKNETYIIISSELLEKMNNHINELITKPNNISPKEGYNIFLKNYEGLINKELNEMNKKYNINDNEICNFKIKKCYKNKYYLKSINNKKV